MAGDDFHVRGQLRRGFFHGVDHALYAAAAGDVNEREAIAHEVVAHVHDIVFREEDDGVAVGVAGGKMQRANVFSVQVHGHVVLKGDDGYDGLGRVLHVHLDGGPVSRGAAVFEPFADVILRHERGACLVERDVPSVVVPVIIRVDDEVD